MRLSQDYDSVSDFVKQQVEIILVDIEGTTTPITFVTEELFPYIKANVEKYLEENWSAQEVIEDVNGLRELVKKDLSDGVNEVPVIDDGCDKSVIKSIVKNVLWQMSKDRKSTALKQLQGNMWKSAYENGIIKGVVYEDVPRVLEKLKKDGKSIHVYSSGSVAAQKLLFGHSDHGNLLHIFSGNFDTKIGNKKESSSYEAIAETINVKPDKILFLTDVYAEAKAAKEAGVNSCILLRPGNKELSSDELDEFTTIKSFEELVEDQPASKKTKES